MLPKVSGGVLAIGRAPYHLTFTEDARPATSMMNLMSPVAHPNSNPIEMMWGSAKLALKRANVNASEVVF